VLLTNVPDGGGDLSWKNKRGKRKKRKKEKVLHRPSSFFDIKQDLVEKEDEARKTPQGRSGE